MKKRPLPPIKIVYDGKEITKEQLTEILSKIKH